LISRSFFQNHSAAASTMLRVSATKVVLKNEDLSEYESARATWSSVQGQGEHQPQQQQHHQQHGQVATAAAHRQAVRSRIGVTK
jgi:hypothetical protein